MGSLNPVGGSVEQTNFQYNDDGYLTSYEEAGLTWTIARGPNNEVLSVTHN